MESLREPLIKSVCKLTLQSGFQSTSVSAIELLAELLHRYLSALCNNIADLSDGRTYRFVDGVAALGLQGESVNLLLRYINEVAPYFPNPPKLLIPLQGRIQLNPPPTKCDTNTENVQSASSVLLNDKFSTDLSRVKTDGVSKSLSTVATRPNGRNIPSWANKSKYKLTCVSYNPTTHKLTTHSPPPPIKPVTPPNKSSVKRRSSRSTASTFRRPLQVSPINSDISGLADDKRREDAWEKALAATVSPPASKTPARNASLPVNSSATPVAAASASTETKTAITPSASVVNERPLISSRRPPPSRKKSSFARRKRPFSAVKVSLPLQSIETSLPSPFPTGESKSVSSHNRSPAVSLSPERPLLNKMEPLTVNTDMAEMVNQQSSSSATDRHSRRSDHQNTPVRRSRPSISSSGGSVFRAIPLSPKVASSGSSLKRTGMTPKSPSIPSPPISHHPSKSTDFCVDDDSTSSADTEPMKLEEESRTYEIPAIRRVPTTAAVPIDRRSIHASSMSSTAPSSSSSTLSSHSTTSELSDVNAPLLTGAELASRPPTTSLAPVNLFSESSPTSTIPGSLAYRTSAIIQTNAPHIVQHAPPQPAPAVASGGGIKLKIRKVGETMSVQSSEHALTNTISSPSSSDGIDGSSSSSSRDTSPLSSRHGSDAETSARRHAAIPPAFIANKTPIAIKQESPRVLFPPSTLPQKQQQVVEPSPLPKAPKIRIKWDAHGKASTSLISAEDSFAAPQRPSVSLDRLRGSSISNEGSSSSSTSRSQSSYDDDDEGHSYQPPPTGPQQIPSLFAPSSIPSRFPSSSTSSSTKPPPQLKPLHVGIPPLEPILHSTASTSSRDKSKRASSIVDTKQTYRATPPVLPKLDLIPSITPTPGSSRKRTKVYSSDDSSSDEEEHKMPIPSTSHSNIRGQAAKKRRVEEDKPVERQQLLASGGSSYYAVENGEKLWLCPICSLPGGDMVGCDGCDDWFHFQCVGLDKAPETEKWFCPSCARSQASATIKKAGSSTSRKHSLKHSSGRRR